MIIAAIAGLWGVLPPTAVAATAQADPGQRDTATSKNASKNGCVANGQIVTRFRRAARRAKSRGGGASAAAEDDLWDRLAACGQIDAITRRQARELTALFYAHSNAKLLAALRKKRSGLAINKMIANAYTRAPDRVQNDPALAAVTSTALIARNRSYNVAYRDLSFAALYHAADPARVRGYLQHFGCLKTDAVWAALTTQTQQFIPGLAFPAATQADDWDRSDLTQARLALLKNQKIPQLSVECPLSDAYAYNQLNVMDYLLHKGKSRVLDWGGELSEHAKTWGDTLHQTWDSGVEKTKTEARHGWSAFYHALPGTPEDDKTLPGKKTDRASDSDP